MLDLALKFVHVIGAAVLLGTGAGIAFFMLMAHLHGRPAVKQQHAFQTHPFLRGQVRRVLLGDLF